MNELSFFHKSLYTRFCARIAHNFRFKKSLKREVINLKSKKKLSYRKFNLKIKALKKKIPAIALKALKSIRKSKRIYLNKLSNPKLGIFMQIGKKDFLLTNKQYLPVTKCLAIAKARRRIKVIKITLNILRRKKKRILKTKYANIRKKFRRKPKILRSTRRKLKRQFRRKLSFYKSIKYKYNTKKRHNFVNLKQKVKFKNKNKQKKPFIVTKGKKLQISRRYMKIRTLNEKLKHLSKRKNRFLYARYTTFLPLYKKKLLRIGKRMKCIKK